MKRIVFVLVLALLSGVAYAQGPDDFSMAIAGGPAPLEGNPGDDVSGSADVSVNLTSAIDDIQGWSFGVETTGTASITAVTISEGVMTILNGGPAAFKTTTAYEPGDVTVNVDPTVDGLNSSAVTQGVVIDFMQQVNLDAPSDYAMVELTVAWTGVAPAIGTTEEIAGLAFTDAIGSPPTATVVVVGGGSIAPAVQAGLAVEATGVEGPTFLDAAYTIAISDAKGATNEIVESVVSLSFNADGSNDGAMIQGWSYGVCLQDASLLAITDATTEGMDVATVKNGGVPDFNTVTVYDGEGVTHGVVIDFMAQIALDATNGFSDVKLTCEILMTADGEMTYIVPCDNTLGSPPTANVMVVQGNSIPGSASEGINPDDCENAESCNKAGEFTYFFDPGVTFIPADANGDTRIDVADGIYILNFLFQAGPVPPCMKAADANADCVVDTSDAIYIIEYQFLDGDAPVNGACHTAPPEECPDLTCEVPQDC